MTNDYTHGRSHDHPVRDFFLNAPAVLAILVIVVGLSLIVVYRMHRIHLEKRSLDAEELRMLLDESKKDKEAADGFSSDLFFTARRHGVNDWRVLNMNELDAIERERFLFNKDMYWEAVNNYKSDRNWYNSLMKEDHNVYTNFPWKLPREIKAY